MSLRVTSSACLVTYYAITHFYSISLSQNSRLSTVCIQTERDRTLCHTSDPIAVEAGPAVAAESRGVVLAVSKLGALIPVICASSKIVREHWKQEKKAQ